ncbi:MAG: hypothetical protein NT076_04630 [Candidatus Pacearchaeota archaeon]|nr:hypothetical protein [Candidatus Pacearchaeota archaeon]
MVHKKFIKRGEKKFGPYLYENYRVNGKTKTRYLGLAKPEEKGKNLRGNYKFFIIGAVLILGLIFFLFYVFNYNGVTGKATIEISQSYAIGEQITGNLNLLLKNGELIPADSIVKIKLNGQEKTISLSSLVTGDKISGNFYAENSQLQGQGEGFGVPGKKTVYPAVDFILLISKEKKEEQPVETPVEVPAENPEQLPQTETPIEQPVEVPIEIPAETPVETPAQAIETPIETTGTPATETTTTQTETTQAEPAASETPSPAPEAAPAEASLITGQATKENKNKKEVPGKASKNQPFSYQLEEGETAEIKKNSVSVDGKKIEDNAVSLSQSGNEISIITEYLEEEQGFGLEYLQSETEILTINLEQFNITAELGTLEVSLGYSNEKIVDASKEIKIEGEQVQEVQENETEIITPEINETIETNITIPELNITNITIANETVQNLTIENLTESSITTLQYKAVINQPVKWLKKIRIEDKTDDFKIKIPKEAENITIKTGEQVEQEEINAKDYEKKVEDIERTSLITGNVVLDSSISKKGFFARLFGWITGRGITGKVISEQDFNSIIETGTEKIVDLNGVVQTVAGNESIGVVYETPAPLAREENLTNGKRIVIYTNKEYNYTDVLAYTLIDNLVSINQSDKIKLYWIRNEETAVNRIESEAVTSVINETITSNETIQTINEQDSSEIVETVSNETIINNESVQTSDESSVENNTASEEIINSSAENLENSVALTGNVISEKIISNNNIPSEPQASEIRVEVAFTAEDLDEDGMIDYIEWNVPHLSNQTFELIIEISKAEHLDENRTFIEDVYDKVKAKDNIWQNIPDGEYLRVTFEKPLDKTRDITIYARGKEECVNGSVIVDNKEVPCEIYEKKKRIDEISKELKNGE